MALTKKAERTKAKLLQSAKKLIGEKGFDRVSVEDITRDSGVAKGSLSISPSIWKEPWWTGAVFSL